MELIQRRPPPWPDTVAAGGLDNQIGVKAGQSGGVADHPRALRQVVPPQGRRNVPHADGHDPGCAIALRILRQQARDGGADGAPADQNDAGRATGRGTHSWTQPSGGTLPGCTSPHSGHLRSSVCS